jgi:Ca-activated chloride channel family protein
LAADDDIAIAIVYDTSGSMNAPVKDSAGKWTPKFMIGNRAVENIVSRLEKFAATSPKKLQVGLYTFALQGGKEVVPMGPFAPAKVRDWVASYKKPDGGTPLGNATAEAAEKLLKIKAGARHVLVITDGENTIGPKPEEKIAALNKIAMKTGDFVAFHFIAFDVNASVFAAIKKEGATLLSAADEKQLNERLTFVLEEKILLEKE